MVREAYKLLKNYVGQELWEMKDHVGYSEQGNGQFNPGGLLVIGAYQEDHTDATNEGYGFLGWFVTNTHFWDPDQGDNSTFDYAGNSYSNAYKKAKKYVYGGYELRVPYPANQIIEAYTAPTNIFQFYKDGLIFYRGYYNSLGQFISRNRWDTASLEFRKKVFWEILGRVCHLLGDMSVPAHVHNDPHPPTNPDSYENYMSKPWNYYQWTFQNALDQGGVIIPNSSNPLKSLFYPVAQIANFFSSNDVDGNDTNGINDSFQLYPGLSEMLQNLNNEFNGPPDKTIQWLSGTSDYAFVYGIRAIAGLLLWIADECNLIPPPLSIPPIISGLSQTPDPICQSSYGYVYCNLSQGNGTLTYTWSATDLPAGAYITPDGNKCKVTYSTALSAKDAGVDQIMAPIAQIYCTVSNSAGSDNKSMTPSFSTNCGGCPTLAFNNGTEKADRIHY